MADELLIAVDDFCECHQIEFSFIKNLQEFGMITVITRQNTHYIEESELGKLERILRLHDDLEINVEGIDTINHLLVQINNLNAEITSLKNRLRRYED